MIFNVFIATVESNKLIWSNWILIFGPMSKLAFNLVQMQPNPKIKLVEPKGQVHEQIKSKLTWPHGNFINRRVPPRFEGSKI